MFFKVVFFVCVVHGGREDQYFIGTMIMIRRINCKNIDLPVDVFQGSLHCVVHGGKRTNICRGLDNNITSAVLQNIGLVNKIRS